MWELILKVSKNKQQHKLKNGVYESLQKEFHKLRNGADMRGIYRCYCLFKNLYLEQSCWECRASHTILWSDWHPGFAVLQITQWRQPGLQLRAKYQCVDQPAEIWTAWKSPGVRLSWLDKRNIDWLYRFLINSIKKCGVIWAGWFSMQSIDG